MKETTYRLMYLLLITGSVIITPVVGVFGPFNNGSGAGAAMREYFLPAGFVFGTVWSINYLGLAAYGIWQALPGQRDNPRVRRALPWLAATAIGNVFWIALAGSTATVPWTVPVLIFMEITAWAAYFKLGIPAGEAASGFEKWLQAALRVYVGWLSVATIANTASALNVLGWDGWGIAPQTWAVIMLVIATIVAWVVGRLVHDDNIYRAVFLYAFIGIILQQSDVPAIVWTAAGGALAIAVMIGATWGRRLRQFATAG
jgi:hypothetical protein